MTVNANDNCPRRGAGLSHTYDKNTGRCIFCEEVMTGMPGDMGVITSPTVRRVDEDAIRPTRPIHERRPQGLIDAVLDLRNQPMSAALLGDPTRKSPEWEAHTAAIDAVLDIIVPALRTIAHSTQDTGYAHGVNCIQKTDVTKAIGRVPQLIGKIYL